MSLTYFKEPLIKSGVFCERRKGVDLLKYSAHSCSTRCCRLILNGLLCNADLKVLSCLNLKRFYWLNFEEFLLISSEVKKAHVEEVIPTTWTDLNAGKEEKEEEQQRPRQLHFSSSFSSWGSASQ